VLISAIIMRLEAIAWKISSHMNPQIGDLDENMTSEFQFLQNNVHHYIIMPNYASKINFMIIYDIYNHRINTPFSEKCAFALQ
jgi:hypothetical protein